MRSMSGYPHTAREKLTKNQLFWNKWMTADCWMEVINRLIDIPKPMEFSVEQLNRAIGRNANYRAANINTMIQLNRIHFWEESKTIPFGWKKN
mgnify:CR=1 FL=1